MDIIAAEAEKQDEIYQGLVKHYSTKFMSLNSDEK
jgi:hypothetical protein